MGGDAHQRRSGGAVAVDAVKQYGSNRRVHRNDWLLALDVPGSDLARRDNGPLQPPA